MKMQSNSTLMLPLVVVLILFINWRPNYEAFDKITVREFELVDQKGTKRVTIQAYPDGEVVLRLIDERGWYA
jgi:hypothetical protein